MRGATEKVDYQRFVEEISIHTPHAGSDRKRNAVCAGKYHFNPHSPCGERPFGDIILHVANLFQSTLPMRGATSVNTDF